jgi:hypothetical protein
MTSDTPPIRLLLDEHYPGWLAEQLHADGVDAVALCQHRPELRGLDDDVVLGSATAEGRVVVTEDVTTFRAAIAEVPDHVGVVFCHHSRYPRTPSGLDALRHALVKLAFDPPDGLGSIPLEWWLPA